MRPHGRRYWMSDRSINSPATLQTLPQAVMSWLWRIQAEAPRKRWAGRNEGLERTHLYVTAEIFTTKTAAVRA